MSVLLSQPALGSVHNFFYSLRSVLIKRRPLFKIVVSVANHDVLVKFWTSTFKLLNHGVQQLPVPKKYAPPKTFLLSSPTELET